VSGAADARWAGVASAAAVSIPGLEVFAEIGRGANARVYLARRDGTDYAVKVLEEQTNDDTALAAFHREAALLAAVGHRGLPRVHQVGRTTGRPYLVMDLVAGRSLADELTTGPIPEARAVTIAKDIADALAAVHRSGLVHRDITPGNIMIPPEGPAKLIDFGLAIRGTGTVDDSAVGTFAYTAAEQAGTLNRPVDGRSDLYSLGVVLYEALTGVLPYRSDDLGTLLRMHAAAQVPDPRLRQPLLSAGVAAVVQTLLAKDPDDRYAGADALLADLHRLERSPADLIPTRTAADTGPAGRLIGRDGELRTLITRWRRAATGHGGVAVLRGAPGSGRGRLLGEVARAAARSGALVLRGRCVADETLPLGALRDAVANHLTALDQLHPAERDDGLRRLRDAAAVAPDLLARLHPALGPPRPAADDDPPDLDLAGPVALADPIPAHHDAGRYAAAVAAFLAELAVGQGAMLLRIDDVQWLDDTSRRVLSELSARLAELPVLIGLTVQHGAGAAGLLAALDADTDLLIGPLDDESVTELLADRLPGMRVSPRLGDLLRTRAQGNPFNLFEYLQAVIDAGLLQPDWGQWRLDEAGLARLDLPERALDLVLSRVARLGAATRRVLTTAAALGARFRVAALPEACELPADQVDTALAEAVNRQLLETRQLPGGTEYAFVHVRVRDALLADLNPDQTAELHQRVALAIGRHPDPDPAHVLALGRHHMRGRPAQTPLAAYQATVAAGQAALSAGAAAAAVDYLRFAAGWAPELTGEFRLLFGTALYRAGELPAALAQLEAALAVTHDRTRRAVVLARIAEVQQAVWELDAVVETARAGLAELGGWAPRGKLGFALASLLLYVVGLLVGRTGIGFGTATGAVRERHRLAVRLNGAGGYAAALNVSPLVLAFNLRALYGANRLGPGRDYAVAMLGLGHTALAAGMGKAAARCFAKVEAHGRSTDDPWLTAWIAQQHASGRYYAGQDGGEAVDALLDTHSTWLDAGPYCDAAALYGQIAATAGRTADLERNAARFRRRLGGGTDPDRTMLLANTALRLALSGQAAEAFTEVDRVAATLGPRQRVLAFVITVARLFAAQESGECGPRQEAAVAAMRAQQDELRPSKAFRLTHVPYVLLAAAQLARLRTGTGDRETQVAATTRAVAAVRKLKHKPPETVAALHLFRADLAQQLGRPNEALAELGLVPVVVPDAPLIGYEVARVRARAAAALGSRDEAARQAGVAMALALANGWPHRARWVTNEFGTPAGRSHGLSRGVTGASAPVELELQRLRAVEEISRLAAQTVDPDELARITLDAMIRILHAERALLFLADPTAPDPSSADLRAHLGRAAGGSTIEAAGYASTLVDKVADSGETLVITGTEQGAALGARSVVAHNLRSIMVAPLQLDGRLLGVVYLDSRAAAGIFTAADAGILSALTTHIAAALQTARSAALEAGVRAARHRQDLAESLRAALVEMSATLDPDAVLAHLLAAAIRLLPAQRALLLLRHEGGTLVVRDGAAAEPWLMHPGAGFETVLGGPHAGPPGSGEASWPGLAELTLGSAWLTVPLLARDEPLGLLLLTGPAPYQDAETALAGTLAAQAVAAYENAVLYARAQRMAVTDELTGIANRRHVLDRAQRQLRDVTCAAVVMLDIDHFKRINDTYGHLTGDDVIREVAARLGAALRPGDDLGRYGGEEFAIVLAAPADPAATAERLRAAVADTPIPTRSGPVPVTVSVGAATATDHRQLDDLLTTADQALYRAKADGRNAVRTG
jgi:eukaryotic-like serine/threonine-protein kinase